MNLRLYIQKVNKLLIIMISYYSSFLAFQKPIERSIDQYKFKKSNKIFIAINVNVFRKNNK